VISVEKKNWAWKPIRLNMTKGKRTRNDVNGLVKRGIVSERLEIGEAIEALRMIATIFSTNKERERERKMCVGRLVMQGEWFIMISRACEVVEGCDVIGKMRTNWTRRSYDLRDLNAKLPLESLEELRLSPSLRGQEVRLSHWMNPNEPMKKKTTNDEFGLWTSSPFDGVGLTNKKGEQAATVSESGQ
jgi:hypothetical protein